MRGTGERNILDEFCVGFCKVAERHAPYIVVSGFVAISSGRARATEDIDMIIRRLALPAFTALHDDLKKEGFVCMQSDDANEVFSYLDAGDSVRYTLEDKPLPEMELKFAKDARKREPGSYAPDPRAQVGAREPIPTPAPTILDGISTLWAGIANYVKSLKNFYK